MQLAIKDCLFQNEKAKELVKFEIRKILENNYSLNSFTIDDAINFNDNVKLPTNIMFDILIYKMRKEHDKDALSYMIDKYNLCDLKFDEDVKNENRLNELVTKVKSGYPLQYALGHTFFVNSNYIVTPDVLIPRPETEQLAVGSKMMIEKLFVNQSKLNIADIGTGSGILAIYLKENFKNKI